LTKICSHGTNETIKAEQAAVSKRTLLR